MKVLFPNNNWVGGFSNSIEKAFRKIGYETFISKSLSNRTFFQKFPLNQIVYLNKIRKEKRHKEHNDKFIEAALDYKPDIIFIFSGGLLLPKTIDYIKKSLKCKIIGYVADYPFDPYRDKYYGMTLSKYDYLLVGDKIWIPNIRKVAPNSEIFHFVGGYDSDLFYPIPEESITDEDVEKLNCEVSFTGGSYAGIGEGNYRAGILAQLFDYNLKVWGTGWNYQTKYFPTLKKANQGGRLSYEDLRKLYSICPINLNIPSPQILTSFQPRFFDIAATKGFQIVDSNEEITKLFGNNVISFNNINELKDKIKYFIDRPSERKEISQKLYEKIVKQYNWNEQIRILMSRINNK